MSDNASVIVFPSTFAENKINQLLSNIKKILKLKDQKYQKIRRDNSIIVVEANDPVFASSAINLLFGIKKVAIAKQVKNDFNSVVTGITKIGSNLLLKGDTYLVQVEGKSSGYLPKDVEIAATSSLIENTVNLGAKPGTEQNHNKTLYTYLTKSNAYVCIFTDEGLGGIPNNSQKETAVCCIFDELSAVSCLETIKQGFDVKFVLCYNKKSELLNLVKILNRILPRTLKSKIDLEFYQVGVKDTSSQGLFMKLQSLVEVLISVAKSHKIKRVSLPISSLIFPASFVDGLVLRLFENNIIPHMPLAGLDNDILENAKEIGLGKFLPKIEKYGKLKLGKAPKSQKIQNIAQQALKTKRFLTVSLGPNNVHDILDSLDSNH